MAATTTTRKSSRKIPARNASMKSDLAAAVKPKKGKAKAKATKGKAKPRGG